MLIRSIRLFLFDKRRDIRCLQNLWNICKIRVMDNIREGVKANLAKTDVSMSVFCGTASILTVVDMEDRNLILPKKVVKFLDHTVKIMNDIITAVMCVASVKSYPKLLVVSDTVVYACQFFKVSSQLRAFSRHSLKCDT